MSDSYPLKKSKESLPQFFWDVTKEVVVDSQDVYKAILGIAILVFCTAIFASVYGSVCINCIHEQLIQNVSNVYLLLPPFVLAIIAMFPAFSDKTKSVLASKLPEGDKAFGAVFLNEFVFLTFWSLVVLGHSTVSMITYSFIKNASSCGIVFISLNFAVSVFVMLSLAYEIFHSIKIMYLLVLKEYY